MTDVPRGGDNLILIGYRGSGKTCVGRRVALSGGRIFVDTDDRVESAAGRSIRRIFETDGEVEFRRWETGVIGELAAGDRQVISVGGGAPLSRDNRACLRGMGTCIWLTAPADVLLRRIEEDERSTESRPALTDATQADEVRQLLSQREQYYAELADLTLDTAALSVNQVAERIMELMHWSDDRHGA